MTSGLAAIPPFFALAWPGGSWQTTVKVTIAAILTYLAVLWLVMVWWTFRDIRARTRDPFLQVAAVFVVLVFNLPGLWLYLIGRPKETLEEAYARTLEEEALLQELEDVKACPTCRRRVADDFIVCPMCQTQLKEPCARCARPLSYAWMACPFCGTARRPQSVERIAPRRPADEEDGAATRRTRPPTALSPALADADATDSR